MFSQLINYFITNRLVSDALLAALSFLSWLVIIHFLLCSVYIILDLFSFLRMILEFFFSQGSYDASHCLDRDDRHKFCKNNCPPTDKPFGYSRCQRYDPKNIFYANSVIYCWTACDSYMYKWARDSVAWWEFWVKRPSDADIAEFKQTSLQHARQCIKDSLNYEISSTENILHRFANDEWHNCALYLLIFLFCVTFLAFLFMVFKKVID